MSLIERRVEALVLWYRENKRPLPWRNTRDPYAIWVSEVMLQQTQVATVIDYYGRWLERFPTLRALAAAGEDDVLHAWQGLGYYSRARRLRQGAAYLVSRYPGRLPETPQAWLDVPGVGRYTAGAVTSIAFGARAPVLDGNVMRVLCRVDALTGNPMKAPLSHQLWRRAESLLVTEDPGEVNQALMELGATVCTPRSPKCHLCPWRESCSAQKEGRAEQFPELPERPKPTAVTMACGIVERRGRFLLVQAPPTAARWASMWMFPTVEVDRGVDPSDQIRRTLLKDYQLRSERHSSVGIFKHAVTRYKITLHAYECHVRGSLKSSHSTDWHPPAGFDLLALPAVHRRIATQIASR